MTVLGEFVMPNGGRVWTATLIDALGALDIEEKTVRQAIARSADRGLLAPEKVGRRTRWSLTDPARSLLTEGTKRIYSLHHEARSWDGRLAAGVRDRAGEPPAAALPAQDAPRLGRIRPDGAGAWVSPWVDREAEANAVLADLGLDGEARTFAGTVGALGDVEGLVAEAWDLDGIRTEYERFIARHQRTRPGTDQEAFVATTQLVHDWRRFPFLEPDLPAELLPRRWSGQRAADLFHRQHGRWSPGAWNWWRERAAAGEG